MIKKETPIVVAITPKRQTARRGVRVVFRQGRDIAKEYQGVSLEKKP